MSNVFAPGRRRVSRTLRRHGGREGKQIRKVTGGVQVARQSERSYPRAIGTSSLLSKISYIYCYFRCFCHSTSEPKPARLSTPHSCGNSCSRPRESGCGHPCPLQCHPGPCPPCQVTTRLPCYCPRKHILTFRCGIDMRGKGKGVRDLSCGEICARVLGCGKHTCKKVCHDGACDNCEVMDATRCWCGKEGKEIRCGVGEEVQCFVEGEIPWVGRFGCDQTCERFA